MPLIYIKTKNSNDTLKIKEHLVVTGAGGIHQNDILKIRISKQYYTYQQISDYFKNHDLSNIDICGTITMAPNGYEFNEVPIVLESHSDYTKDIEIESYDDAFIVRLYHETTTSISAKQAQQDIAIAQSAVIESYEQLLK